MMRFFLSTVALVLMSVCSVGSASSFSVQEITLSEERVSAVGESVFLLEKVYDDSDISRDRFVDIIRTYGEEKSLGQYPLFMLLMALIDYPHQGVLLTMETSYGTYTEYVGGVKMTGTVSSERVGGPTLDCMGGLPMTGEACEYVSVAKLSVDQLIYPHMSVFSSADYPLPLDTWWLGCERGNAIGTYVQHYMGGEHVTIMRESVLGNIGNGSEHTYIAQILPLEEKNYGAHGPSPFHCQSRLSRVERVSE